MTKTDEMLIRTAIKVAQKANPKDVPIGAVIFTTDGNELASATNNRESTGDPVGHAEIIAMRKATSTIRKGWRLEGLTLAVTIEPCMMCVGALVLARIKRVVFGAWEPKSGAVGSLWDLLRDHRLNHQPEVIGGILTNECSLLLKNFFLNRRLSQFKY